MQIEQSPNLQIKITGKDEGSVESRSVEANLLFAILDKLEEIKCGLIDVEHVIEKD